MKFIYGILDSNGCHIDVSTSLLGAKKYATRHGYTVVTVRYNGWFNAAIVAKKENNKWVNV